MPAAYLGIVVLGAGGGSVAASNFGGGLAGIATAGYDYAGLYDIPGANSGPAPMGEFGDAYGTGLYNEGAVAPPPEPDLRVAEECYGGKWTERGCSYDIYDNLRGLYIPVVAEMYFGVQAAWTWLFGAGSAAEASTTATAAPKLFSSQEVQGLKQLFGTGLQGAQEGLKRVVGGARGLPPGVTRSTLERYRAQIMAKGFEKVPVQQERLRIIAELLK